MARPAPTHRELNSGRDVHAGQWHEAGDRPEGPPDCFEVDPIFRLTGPIPAPVVRVFTVSLLPGAEQRGDLDNAPHSRAGLFTAGPCELPMREHGWLPYKFGEPGTGWLLCPGDWLITYDDGAHRAVADREFAGRYQPL